MAREPTAADEVGDYEAALRLDGTDPITLTAWAKLLVPLKEPEFSAALGAWQTEANEQRYWAPMGPDADFGALILEALGDECSDPAQKRRLYAAAQLRAEGYASGATSGGEGMARMIRVHRVEAKLRRLR